MHSDDEWLDGVLHCGGDIVPPPAPDDRPYYLPRDGRQFSASLPAENDSTAASPKRKYPGSLRDNRRSCGGSPNRKLWRQILAEIESPYMAHRSPRKKGTRGVRDISESESSAVRPEATLRPLHRDPRVPIRGLEEASAAGTPISTEDADANDEECSMRHKGRACN